MTAFNPQINGPFVAELLAMAPLNELGPGRPNIAARAALEAMTDDDLFPTSAGLDQDPVAACRSALWLRHDFLHESHAICQDINSHEGSFWHGIMHRREPDPDNSKYWFRRVGEHPIFEPLRQAAADLACQSPAGRTAEFLATQPTWDPYRWIDLCEAARTSQAGEGVEILCRRIQLCEWELLFDFCYRLASGEAGT
jgi:hypothetical protein